jgi:N-acetylglucosamine-6-phosphate deacetylase
LETNLDGVVLVTMGAESQQSSKACALVTSLLTNVSIGHTRPTREQFEEMVANGASLVTHLFNAMSGLHHREPGLAAWALLEPKICASIIADGVHVSSELVSLSFAAEAGGMVLVTDSVAWRSGIAGEIKMSVVDGAARLADGTLAGSTITMPDAIKFCVHQADVPLPLAIQAATTTPSRLLRQNDRGVIVSGCRADLTALTDELDVAGVWVSGQQVR